MKSYAENSYSNKLVLAEFLLSSLPLAKVKKTPFVLLLGSYNHALVFDQFCQIIISLQTIATIHENLVLELFKHCSVFSELIRVSRYILLIAFHFTRGKSVVERLISEKKMPKLIVNIKSGMLREKV
jgi:hypothetical protein